MVPVDSHRVSRAPRYSGYHYQLYILPLRDYHSLWLSFPTYSSSIYNQTAWSYNPNNAVTLLVWATLRSLATTYRITIVFFSSAYLDVSVQRVRLPINRNAMPSTWRVAPFGYLRIKSYVPIPTAFRSLSRPSSPLRA